MSMDIHEDFGVGKNQRTDVYGSFDQLIQQEVLRLAQALEALKVQQVRILHRN